MNSSSYNEATRGRQRLSDRPGAQPIPIPRSRPSRDPSNSPRGYSRVDMTVGGLSAVHNVSPLMARYLAEQHNGRPPSPEMPFPMDDVDYEGLSMPPSPGSSMFGSPPSPSMSTARQRRPSTGHPSFAPSMKAPSPLSDYSSFSSDLPKLDLSSFPSKTSGSLDSGGSELFSRRGSTSSDASSVGMLSPKDLDSSSMYGMPPSSKPTMLGSPAYPTPRKTSPRPSSAFDRGTTLPPLFPTTPASFSTRTSYSMSNSGRPPSYPQAYAFDSASTLPPLQPGPSSRPSYGYASSTSQSSYYTPSGPPYLSQADLRDALAGKTKRTKFTIGPSDDDDDGYSSSSSSPRTPRPTNKRFFA